jgi:uncharacterized iron-regulated membrane protein
LSWVRTFWRQPRKLRVRAWLFQMHLWVGLVLGLVISVVGLTGAIVVFRVELNRLTTPGTAYVRPAMKRLSLDELVARVQANRPLDRVRSVAFDGDPDIAWNVRTETPEGHRLHTFIDQYRGVITGQDDYSSKWLQWIFDLHAYLLAGKQGEFLNGFVALAALAMSLSGIVIWWPGRRNWRSGFRYHLGGPWERQNYDLHKLVGFCSSLMLAVVSFTGAYFAFPEMYRKWTVRITRSTDVTDPDGCAIGVKLRAKTLLSDRRVPIEDYITSAERALPGARVVFLALPQEPGDPVGLKLKEPNDWHRVGLSNVYLEPAAGEVIRADRFSEVSLGSKFIRLMLPLHFGRFGGRLGLGPVGIYGVLALYVIVGLAVPFLMITGILMYWSRSLSKKFKRHAMVRRAPSNTAPLLQ